MHWNKKDGSLGARVERGHSLTLRIIVFWGYLRENSWEILFVIIVHTGRQLCRLQIQKKKIKTTVPAVAPGQRCNEFLFKFHINWYWLSGHLVTAGADGFHFCLLDWSTSVTNNKMFFLRILMELRGAQAVSPKTVFFPSISVRLLALHPWHHFFLYQRM